MWRRILALRQAFEDAGRRALEIGLCDPRTISFLTMDSQESQESTRINHRMRLHQSPEPVDRYKSHRTRQRVATHADKIA